MTRFEAAYQQLRQMLLDRRYLPKERLVEADLVDVLGVSRSTVRGVLIRLEQEGLVELEPNRGAHVSTLTFDEAVQLFEIREVLEGLIARIAADHITDETIARLGQLCDAMERALDEGDVVNYVDSNREFHETIWNVVGDHRSVKLLHSLSPQVVRQQFQTVLLPGRRDKSLGEHHDIRRALAAHDAQAAETAARAHARAVRDAFLKAGPRITPMIESLV
jgi:DNA-binding GntR family transcriptional regulator